MTLGNRGRAIENSIRPGSPRPAANAIPAGVITTPGIAYVTKRFDFDAGIVISASHNPYEDNGIKIFLPTGMKLDEAAEKRIEAAIAGSGEPDTIPSNPAADEDESLFHLAYLAHLNEAAARIKLNDYRLVIDVRTGQRPNFASEVFHNFGGGVVVINDRPGRQEYKP